MRIYLLAFLFISIASWSQDKGCYDYFLEYCEKEGRCDTVNGRPKIEFKYFCDGIYEALESDTLGLKFSGNLTYNTCHFYSYYRHGIRVYSKGCFIGEGEISHNAGYNFIMRSRIIEKIGKEEYNKLGKVDLNWLFAKPEDYETLRQCFETKNFTDSTYFIRLNREKLKKTKFGQLDHVTFEFHFSKEKVLAEDLYRGITLRFRDETQLQTFLKMDFSEYSNENYEVCTVNNKGHLFYLEIRKSEFEDSGNQYHQSKKKLKWE